jgi:hypothetical protein
MQAGLWRRGMSMSLTHALGPEGPLPGVPWRKELSTTHPSPSMLVVVVHMRGVRVAVVSATTCGQRCGHHSGHVATGSSTTWAVQTGRGMRWPCKEERQR